MTTGGLFENDEKNSKIFQLAVKYFNERTSDIKIEAVLKKDETGNELEASQNVCGLIEEVRKFIYKFL
jgi:hypothetical protein